MKKINSKRKLLIERRAKLGHKKKLRRKFRFRGGHKFFSYQSSQANSLKETKKSSKDKRKKKPLTYKISFPPTIEFLTNATWHKKRGSSKKGSEYIFKVPSNFSLIENPKDSYGFLYELFFSLINQQYNRIFIDYSNCQKIELGAQVFMDIILKDFLKYLKQRQSSNRKNNIKLIRGININNIDVQKVLFSVGSFATLLNKKITFPDILPFDLRIRDRESNADQIKIQEKKDVDTTELIDYVIECLKRINRKLSAETRSDLCQVIGEILINAEEHSTTRYRYSVGYFKESVNNNKHYGIFNLVIFNLGQTIYEKFADPNCPTQHVVNRMKDLSRQYTENKWMIWKQFEEETLWTLYALQEGVTSKINYQKRGNGSIQFIESFFNIKGDKAVDDISCMTILSGNTKITFDGTYKITDKYIDGERYKMMTFNNSGKIEDKPDQKYVTFVENYFPGTMICAKILLNDDDFVNNGEKSSHNITRKI